MIHVDSLAVRVGTFALKNVELQVATGQYAMLMGRTGSGKTTLLETICGLKPVLSGTISLMGRNVTHLKPAARGIGFVPQDGALFSTMKVREQIGFALSIRSWKKADIDKRVDELAELLGVTHLLDRYPAGLSGGEQQRISLGRALAAKPGVLCLDEPLSALDESTREEMYSLLKSVQKHTGVTALHITHSKTEARNLGDIIFQIEDGVVRKMPAENLQTSKQNGQRSAAAKHDTLAASAAEQPSTATNAAES